ncbi:hypothetical protein ACVWXN_003207 [Bradyrhizobium sp. i1.4.4]
MAKIINPRLFSQQFGVPKADIDKAGFLDPLLNADTKLFIDPLLLRKSSNSTLRTKGVAAFRKRTAEIVSLLMATPTNSGPAWTAALRLLDLHERRETCLGYGGAGTSGSSRPDGLKARILNTTRDFVKLGVTNPEIIGLMGIFEDDVGPDTISDMTTNSLLAVLQEITLRFCSKYNIPTKKFILGLEEYELPINPLVNGHGFLLVPKDVLRELPVATDWSDIDRVVQHNAMLRKLVNAMIGNIAKATIKEKKHALKTLALQSESTFQKLFTDLLAGNLQGYDFGKDRRNVEALRETLTSTPQKFPVYIAKPASPSIPELHRVVNEITAQFKHLVENCDLSRLLWDNSNPKSEKATQLVYFGVADSYCKANNIDISPEVHSGGGPVDFKFSTGYAGRLLVEMKLSKGKVVQGYEEQLETYKAAAQTEEALFLIIDVGKMGSKLTKIKKIRAERLAAGQRAADIVVVDAKRKPSASKR